METIQKKTYQLEQRTFEFAKRVRELMKSTSTIDFDSSEKNQIIRCSGSVGANFIEAKEALSRKDFLMRIKICRKEAEETRYWLRLLCSGIDENKRAEIEPIIQEALELTKIFGSIINKHND